MRAVVTVTTRAGGVSRPPYDTNNLAVHVGDDPQAVAVNRARLAASLGVDRVQFMHQVHGSDVRDIATPGPDVDGVDAIVTARGGLGLAVLVADCVPVAVWGEHALGVAHAGRRGVAGGVVAATVDAVRRLDDGPLRAVIGPAICGGCYEVPAPMQDDVVAAVPAALSTTRWGTPSLDLPAAVRAQLRAAGVSVDDAEAVCTFEDDAYYSHRREGATGRFALVGMLVE